MRKKQSIEHLSLLYYYQLKSNPRWWYKVFCGIVHAYIIVPMFRSDNFFIAIVDEISRPPAESAIRNDSMFAASHKVKVL